MQIYWTVSVCLLVTFVLLATGGVAALVNMHWRVPSAGKAIADIEKDPLARIVAPPASSARPPAAT